ncbi:FTR1 family iron permease [Cerasicoccus maritimus]|uniref:FTR1 family iron permease n=1 Tax=Cerasicoccus maritimus TaxID=490089 RepID=UPI0028527E34|nr:FTR1 family protein [Cerasicoccus maritimus]
MKTIATLFITILLAPLALFAEQGLTENYEPVVAAIVERGDAAMAAYSPATATATGNEFSRLYFDVFEGSGMEFTLDLKSSDAMLKIESGFSLIISQCMRSESKESIEATWKQMKVDMDYAVQHYSSGEEAPSFWGRVVQSFLILFREGIEAMLVVAALVAYLRRSGYSDKVKVIWWSCGLALIASVGAAWLLTSVIQASGANQEVIEGVTMLIAAAVLVYVSYWLTAKRDADRWQAFVKKSMDQAISGGSMFALGLVAFLAVFREGAETILFYQALMVGSGEQNNSVWIGMAIAAVGLVAVYFVVRFASIKLPISLFFGSTAVLLFAMAFVFTGQGILELQVGSLVQTTRLDGWPMVSWLGIFPTRETMIGQALILAAIPAGWLWLKWSEKQQAVVAQ